MAYAMKIQAIDLGWLSMCQMGFLHRGISISNVKILTKVSKTLRFKVRRDETDPPPLKDVARDELVEFLLKRMSMDRPTDLAMVVEGLLDDLGFSDMCTGFVVGGGLAIDWKTYFTSPHLGSMAVSLYPCFVMRQYNIS